MIKMFKYLSCSVEIQIHVSLEFISFFSRLLHPMTTLLMNKNIQWSNGKVRNSM